MQDMVRQVINVVIIVCMGKMMVRTSIWKSDKYVVQYMCLGTWIHFLLLWPRKRKNMFHVPSPFLFWRFFIFLVIFKTFIYNLFLKMSQSTKLILQPSNCICNISTEFCLLEGSNSKSKKMFLLQFLFSSYSSAPIKHQI